MTNLQPIGLLAQMKPVVWFLGFGVGCAAGLAFAVGLIGTLSGAPTPTSVIAFAIAAVHSTIIIAFWQQRDRVRIRTAVMVSMLASALLTFLLGWSNGSLRTPFFGLALMHALMAFFHPAIYTTSQTTAPPST